MITAKNKLTAKKILFTVACLVMVGWLNAQYSANRRSFNEGWRFFLGQPAGDPAAASFNANSWRKLRLPHDWSVELPFDKESPTGTGGGALRGGLGWYRKTIDVPASWKDKKVFIDFDGVYMNSEVFINGHSLGIRPNGYISFRYDLTPFLQAGADNILLVKVDNSQQPNSRWYSGSGIYRNVWLTVSDPVHIAHWGVQVLTPAVSRQKAEVQIATRIENEASLAKNIRVETIIVDAAGKQVGQAASSVQAVAGKIVERNQSVQITHPQLWSVDRPYLYKVISKLWDGPRLLDRYETPLGLRYFHFDADKGFFLNDQSVKIRGVCMHHDLGALGTAINGSALKRQLRILKEMGCNGIRTSHNPPAPELLELCDSMGFVVMDEAFDMWARQKNKFDYHLYWDAWHKKDLEDQLLRDRNHPSVIMWSLGNEIPEQWGGKDSTGKTILRELVSITRRLDPSRPAVTANNETQSWNNLLQANADDIIGYNYNHRQWDSVQYRWGKKPFIVTESVSALQTRGHYDMPSDSIRKWPPAWDKPLLDGNADTTCSAYDNCHAPWGSTHEESLKALEKFPHVSGMFIWTGFDYLGEPTPYPWPARSSYFGIVDLAGFPKDVYYLYQSYWTNKPVLHIFPHWNWQAGQLIDVWAYYNNADEVELFLNGKSLGIRKKTGDEMHVVWRTHFEAGVLKAVSRKNGKQVLVKEIKTAGEAASIGLTADVKNLRAGSDQLCFISVTIRDENGTMVPSAENLVNFSVTGAGKLVAVDNGSPTSLESFQANRRKAFKGKCLLIVRAKGEPGKVIVKAMAEGVKAAQIVIPVLQN